MSETQERAHKGAHKATATAAAAAAPQTKTASVDTETVHIRQIEGMDVPLTVKFFGGMPMNDIHAKALNNDYETQFVNNMTANLKARAKRLAAATTEAERAANRPLTVEEIAEAYRNYERSFFRGDSRTSAETLEYNARFNAYIAAELEHNALIAKGLPGVFASKGVVKIRPLPKRVKGQDDAEFKAAYDEAMDKRRSFLERFASLPQYADRIEAERAKLRAASGKDDKPQAEEASEEMFG